MDWRVLYRRNILFSDLETLQKELVDEVRKKPGCGYLVVSEPKPTLTSGRSGTLADLLVSESVLKEKGIQCVNVSRGGKWTYHGPGQIVIYPIVSLGALGFGKKEVKKFLDCHRMAVLNVFSQWGLSAEAGEEPYGIYQNGQKLVSFGMDIREGIVRHGLAIYHSDQTSGFQWIHPCGVPLQRVTSVKESLGERDWQRDAQELADSIKTHLKTR